jgi:predicted transcriptional regulator of viral defense system
MIQNLRRLHPIEEFDYPLLLNFLRDYKKPRDKISRLLKDQAIIRVKKGLYIFGPDYQRSPVCLETLANLIYGPSYLSLEYALSFHGLIPERVEKVTSITTEKDKFFKTPIGVFTYRHLNLQKYSVGIDLVNLDSYHTCLIASKEKALADLIAQPIYRDLRSREELLEFLTDNLRIEMQQLIKLNKKRLHEISAVYKHRRVYLLEQLVRKWHE